MIPLIAMSVSPVIVSAHLAIWPLVPPQAAQGWKLELFELSEPVAAHYHKIQKQFILVTEGQLNLFFGDEEPVLAQSGELFAIDPGTVHALAPVTTARFLAIDLPGFDFPEDVFYGQSQMPVPWIAPNAPAPLLNEKYFGEKIDAGEYAVYEILNGAATGGKWSAALLELHNSPQHYHCLETEHFIVVAGKLSLEIDGRQQIVDAGSCATLMPKEVHQLKSATEDPVRVLCFSFPAFDPADMYLVE